MPSAAVSTFRNMKVSELSDGMEIDQVLLVREVERRRRRDGGDYLRLQLGDRTGAVSTMVWEELARGARAWLAPGSRCRCAGRYNRHPRFGPQINLRGLSTPAPGSYALEDLLDGPARSAEQLEADLRELLSTIQDPHLALLLERVFAEGSRSCGRATEGRPRLSTTTRPTATGCWSTAWGWRRR